LILEVIAMLEVTAATLLEVIASLEVIALTR
jgi:hypothetical protein